MPRLEEQFGKRLRELRKKRGWSQEKLADMVGVSYQAISNIERGISGPAFTTLADIAKALKVKPKELFDF